MEFAKSWIHKLSDNSRVFAILICLLLFLLLIVLFADWSYDDPYITYRYASNLIEGKGFVYNPNARTLSTTTPFFALLLAIIGKLELISITRAAIIIGCLSIVLAGYVFLEISKQQNTPLIGWASFLLLTSFALPVTTVSSETPLYIFMALLTFLFYFQQKWLFTAILAALLAFVRPDGILLPFVLIIDWTFQKKRAWHTIYIREYLFPILTFILINLLGWGAIWLYFGSPFPVTLFAKQQQGTMQISQQFLAGFLRLVQGYSKLPYMMLEGVLAVIGLIYLIARKKRIFLIVVWVFAYFIAYSILRVSRYFWYYAPLVPGFVVLVSAGFQFLWESGSRLSNAWKTITGGVIVCFFLFSLVNQLYGLYNTAQNTDKRIPIYRQLGLWLRQNTPSDAKVGALEVGVIGYYSKRYMVDFAGLIQPDVAAQMTTTSTYEDTARYAIGKYRPDYIVLHKRVFQSLEKELLEKCTKEKVFRGDKFQANFDLIILNCYP
jgi:hypothetical protein